MQSTTQNFQSFSQEQTTFNLHKQDLMNIMKDYITQKINRIETVNKLDELEELVKDINVS